MVCDANYEFTMVDIGDSGRQSDGGVYASSKLGYAKETDLLHIPDPDFIANSGNNWMDSECWIEMLRAPTLIQRKQSK